MNRADFMKQLESLLQDISQAEREEALQYYNDYFDDAEPGSEQAVIDALGTPAKVAENIKNDLLTGGSAEAVKVTAADRKMIPYETQTEGNGSNDAGDTVHVPAGDSIGQSDPGEKKGRTDKNSKWSPGTIALIVVLAIFASPILLAIGGALLGVTVGVGAALVSLLLGLLAVWFSLIVSFGAVTLALLATGVVLAVVAAICFFGHPLIGLSVLGVGLLCGGIGFLFLMLTVGMAGVATPALGRFVKMLARKLFGRKKATKAA